MGTPSDLTGVLIAEKYELVRKIGRGNMGAVYEARNVSTFKRCAIKVLLTPELAGDEEVVRRFFREARASGLIESEHVVAAFDSGIDSTVGAYYVMERLEGEDLQQALKRLGALNPIAAAKIVLQAACGLSSAHALSIVHRDVKPANLFLALGPGGEIKVKILDFGVAKVKMEVFHESLHSQQTHRGSMLGTPLYMSPEQVKRASDIDDSADVWSLGVVLFECLSGKLPWGKVESVGELIAAILTQPLPLLQDYAAWVPPELAAVAHHALSRDPAHRMRSATELRDALSRFVGRDTRLFDSELVSISEHERRSAAERVSLADTMIMPAGVGSGAPSTVSIAPAPTRRGLRLAVIGGVAAVLGATAWNVSRRPTSPPVTANASLLVAHAAEPAASSVEEAASAAPPIAKALMLAVAPPGITVSVDGLPAVVSDGHVSVAGVPGSVHQVKVSLGRRSSEYDVVVTSNGLSPTGVKLISSAPAGSHGVQALASGGSGNGGVAAAAGPPIPGTDFE